MSPETGWQAGTTFITFGAVPVALRSAKQGIGNRVPRARANLCQLYAACMLFLLPARRNVAGAPGTGVVMGRGWGAFRLAAEENVKFGLRGYV